MNARLITGLGLALALGACASAPQPNAALETASAQVAAAEADPNVAKYDPVDAIAFRRRIAGRLLDAGRY